VLPIPLSPRIFYPEYPENPRAPGEIIRKAGTDRCLVIKKVGELVAASETTAINWELRGRRPEEKFHGPLKRVLDIDVELECSK